MSPPKTLAPLNQTAPTAANAFSPVRPEVEKYLRNLYPHRSPSLEAMETFAAENRFPIVGPLVGQFLSTLTKMVNARTIFEFGSGFGYSAYWFHRGMQNKGEIICTDGDPKNKELAKDFLEKECWNLIKYYTGWAQDIFNKSNGPFDIIYNDVDKDAYPEVWKLAKDRVEPGGLYIADNVLWSCRVVGEKPIEDPRYPKWTAAIVEHNNLIASDPEFDFFINPTRDGLIIARRKEEK